MKYIIQISDELRIRKSNRLNYEIEEFIPEHITKDEIVSAKWFGIGYYGKLEHLCIALLKLDFATPDGDIKQLIAAIEKYNQTVIEAIKNAELE